MDRTGAHLPPLSAGGSQRSVCSRETAGPSAALPAPFGTLAKLPQPTPPQLAGPFSPADLPLDDDAPLPGLAILMARETPALPDHCPSCENPSAQVDNPP
jgi:hypothetical protein